MTAIAVPRRTGSRCRHRTEAEPAVGKNGIPAAPPDRTFLFVCEQCGIYPATEETARKFMTESLELALDRELRAGAVGADLTFAGRCPRCAPCGVYRTQVAALWPPRIH